MKKMLISIKPKYVKKILDGEKKYEFRTKAPKKPVKSMVIYCTAPYKQIVGEIEMVGVIEKAPEQLWELTKENAGVNEADFFEYFKNRKVGYAYKLGKIKKYHRTKSLKDLGINSAPQSFVYI